MSAKSHSSRGALSLDGPKLTQVEIFERINAQETAVQMIRRADPRTQVELVAAGRLRELLELRGLAVPFCKHTTARELGLAVFTRPAKTIRGRAEKAPPPANRRFRGLPCGCFALRPLSGSCGSIRQYGPVCL
jgi:hypothetical protein